MGQSKFLKTYGKAPAYFTQFHWSLHHFSTACEWKRKWINTKHMVVLSRFPSQNKKLFVTKEKQQINQNFFGVWRLQTSRTKMSGTLEKE